MKILLYSVTPVNGGEETELRFELSEGENFENTKLTVSAEMFFELSLPLTLRAPVEFTPARYEHVLFLAEKNAAVKKGLNLLSFGDNTKKGLVRKLTAKGFSKTAAVEAADLLEEEGYIDESASAAALAHDLAHKKLYGRRRIVASLYSKGFLSSTAEAAIEEAEIDFTQICRKRIDSMGGSAIFAEQEEKRKAVAALLRYGFSMEEIRDALKRKC